jgi:poly-gamma-glutamate capsule biosynthesis protein CapA/YwtB (metallophosphatase superfamily)
MVLKKSMTVVIIFSIMLMLFSCRTQKQSRGIVIAAAGDLVVARSLDAVTKEHGDEYPFLKIKDHLDKADIAFANLESVVADNAKIRSKDPKKINYNAPSSVMGVLVKSGFDVFSIANNHIFDLGKKGLSEFRGLLDKTGLHYGGAGKNLEAGLKTSENQS